MDWKIVESSKRPESLDKTSSHVYNYVRQNIVEKMRTDSRTGESIPYFEYEEKKIAKNDWALYEEIISHGSALNDVYAALTELAEMIQEV